MVHSPLVPKPHSLHPRVDVVEDVDVDVELDVDVDVDVTVVVGTSHAT
jgi:hypothetical protein